MFKIYNKKIGEYIAELIKSNQYKSDREFARKYIAKRDGILDESTIDYSVIQNMQNRICQIKKGNKCIQIEDLPIFADLLGVSIENILSAGTSCAPSTTRVTNYSIAFSNNPDEWDSYINRNDKLILNPDEYNKTVLDYAFEFSNYKFLKYLMDKGYIWFVFDKGQELRKDKNYLHNSMTDKENYSSVFWGHGFDSFGAGTSIQRREFCYMDLLDLKLKTQDDLRFGMISLAIKNKDFDMLDRLRARELPMLYELHLTNFYFPEKLKLPESKNVNKLLQNIAICPNEILEYFFEAFTIESNYYKAKNTFIFPFAGNVLDLMIKNKATNVARFIEMAIKHNETVLSKLNKGIKNSIQSSKQYYDQFDRQEYSDEFIKKQSLRYYYFNSNTGFISFHEAKFSKKGAWNSFLTNVVNVTTQSNNEKFNYLINELNETYNLIKNKSPNLGIQ